MLDALVSTPFGNNLYLIPATEATDSAVAAWIQSDQEFRFLGHFKASDKTLTVQSWREEALLAMVIMHDQRPIGFTTIAYFGPSRGDGFEVGRMVIHPEMRGCGIARSTVKHLCTTISRTNPDLPILVRYLKENTASHALVRSLPFIPTHAPDWCSAAEKLNTNFFRWHASSTT